MGEAPEAQREEIDCSKSVMRLGQWCTSTASEDFYAMTSGNQDIWEEMEVSRFGAGANRTWIIIRSPGLREKVSSNRIVE